MSLWRTKSHMPIVRRSIGCSMKWLISSCLCADWRLVNWKNQDTAMSQGWRARNTIGLWRSGESAASGASAAPTAPS